MYRVVIIDDEPIIVKGLSRMVPWEEYNCEFVAAARDGVEGREVIRHIKPDIVFSDICMPNLDGLKMLAGLRSEFPDMQITILTGYRDFAYAKTALEIGVTRFLLKPSNMNEIESALLAMTDKLDKLSNRGDAADKNDESNDSLVDGMEDQTEGKASSLIVKSALEYIERNYNKKLTLQEVADSVYVSQWHLSKLLNKNMDQNFSELLNTVRIKKAKELLRNPSYRVGDVAEMVGFNSSAHFSSVFRKMTGTSANEFRNTVG